MVIMFTISIFIFVISQLYNPNLESYQLFTALSWRLRPWLSLLFTFVVSDSTKFAGANASEEACQVPSLILTFWCLHSRHGHTGQDVAWFLAIGCSEHERMQRHERKIAHGGSSWVSKCMFLIIWVWEFPCWNLMESILDVKL